MGIKEACCSPPPQAIANILQTILAEKAKNKLTRDRFLDEFRHSVRFCCTVFFLLYPGTYFSPIVKRGSSCVFATFPKYVSAQPRPRLYYCTEVGWMCVPLHKRATVKLYSLNREFYPGGSFQILL